MGHEWVLFLSFESVCYVGGHVSPVMIARFVLCLHTMCAYVSVANGLQVGVVNRFNLPYEVVGTDRKSRLRILPSVD